MSREPLNKASLELLGRMSDDWTDTTNAMLSVTIALVLRKLNLTTITIDLDPRDINRLIGTTMIDRTYFYDRERNRHKMTITLAPRGLTDGETDDARDDDADSRAPD